MPKLNPDDLKSEPADLYARTGDLTPQQKFMGEIKSCLVGDDYEWADDTLRGMLRTAEKGIVTEAMRNALERIKDNPGGRRGRTGW